MSDWQSTTTLGRSGVETGRLGLGSSFGIGGADLEHAFEHGVSYFYWGSIRKPHFGKGVKTLAQRHREQMVIVVQSYTRIASLMRRSLESALRKLDTEYADFLLLGSWNDLPPPRILDAAIRLRDEGKARHLMISCHDRPSFQRHAACNDIDTVMVRYNAAHPGAENEVFDSLGPQRPGVVAYTATRWGDLLDPALVPEQEALPRASDCYRFVLTHPMVDVCITGLANRRELDEALATLERGPMDVEELAWMKRVGVAVKRNARPNAGAMGSIDRMMRARGARQRRLAGSERAGRQQR